jgi:hypothetical protein
MSVITRYINKSDFLLKKRFCIYKDDDCDECFRDCDANIISTNPTNPTNSKTRPDYTDRYSVTRDEYIQNLRFKGIGFRYMGKGITDDDNYYKKKA